jgi:hypothetical protein
MPSCRALLPVHTTSSLEATMKASKQHTYQHAAEQNARVCFHPHLEIYTLHLVLQCHRKRVEATVRMIVECKSTTRSRRFSIYHAIWIAPSSYS